MESCCCRDCCSYIDRYGNGWDGGSNVSSGLILVLVLVVVFPVIDR